MADVFVFDKAAYHLETVQEHGLDARQAYVHGGLFFGWAVSRGLTQGWLEDNTAMAFAQFRDRQITGPELFAQWDGALVDDLFTDPGLAFVCTYLPFKTGQYLDDYTRTLVGDLASEYHVQDTWENFDRLGAVLDARHAHWRATWDPSAARTDPRATARAPRIPSGTVALPVLAITRGVPLPVGTLGVRAGRPSSLSAVAQGEAAGGWLALVPVCDPGAQAEPGADALGEVGVLARIDKVTTAEDHPSKRDVLLSLVARVEVLDWVDRAKLLATTRVEVAPRVSDDDRPAIEALRHGAAAQLRARMGRSEAPGWMALAPALDGSALIDAIARALDLTRPELLLVLEAPVLATRAEVVAAGLARA